MQEWEFLIMVSLIQIIGSGRWFLFLKKSINAVFNAFYLEFYGVTLDHRSITHRLKVRDSDVSVPVPSITRSYALTMMAQLKFKYMLNTASIRMFHRNEERTLPCGQPRESKVEIKQAIDSAIAVWSDRKLKIRLTKDRGQPFPLSPSNIAG